MRDCTVPSFVVKVEDMHIKLLPPFENVDAFVDIAKAGKITGARKGLDKGRQVYAFGAGTKKLYDYVNDNPECMSAPVSYTNDIRSISSHNNFMSINFQTH